MTGENTNLDNKYYSLNIIEWFTMIHLEQIVKAANWPLFLARDYWATFDISERSLLHKSCSNTRLEMAWVVFIFRSNHSQEKAFLAWLPGVPRLTHTKGMQGHYSLFQSRAKQGFANDDHRNVNSIHYKPTWSNITALRISQDLDALSIWPALLALTLGHNCDILEHSTSLNCQQVSCLDSHVRLQSGTFRSSKVELPNYSTMTVSL